MGKEQNVKERENGRGREMERRVEELKGKLKKKEREERRRNIVIKGMKVEGRKIKETVKEVIKKMGVEMDIEEVRRTGGRNKEGKEMVIVRLMRIKKRR